jgi:hypothetical protein
MTGARDLLAPLLPAVGQTINQRLRRNPEIGKALVCAPLSGHCAKTIHAVKGNEFPAVCVVVSTSKAKEIIDYLTPVNPAAVRRKRARSMWVHPVPVGYWQSPFRNLSRRDSLRYWRRQGQR